MNTRTTLLLLGLLLFASQIVSADEWYRWVDSEGRAIISRKPPPEGAQQRYRPTLSQRETNSTVQKTGRLRAAQVELYTTSWCPRCNEARAYLQQQGIPFREYDVEKDPAADRRRKTLDPRNGVPLAVINGHKILGFSPDAYQQALGATP